VLRAQSGNSPGAPGDLAAETQLSVSNSDITGIVLAPHAIQPVDLSGTFLVAHGGTPEPMVINLRPMTGNSVTAHSNEDGTFVFKGLLPGHYTIQARLDLAGMSPGEIRSRTTTGFATPTSARIGGQEVLQRGFDLDGTQPPELLITLSPLIIVQGKLIDPSGQPVAGAVLAFKGSAHEATAMSGSDGVFRVAFLAADDYHVVKSADPNSLRDPDYLAVHAKDFPVLHIIAGQNPPITLVAPPVK
jgi:hypothetical protein